MMAILLTDPFDPGSRNCIDPSTGALWDGSR